MVYKFDPRPETRGLRHYLVDDGFDVGYVEGSPARAVSYRGGKEVVVGEYQTLTKAKQVLLEWTRALDDEGALRWANAHVGVEGVLYVSKTVHRALSRAAKRCGEALSDGVKILPRLP